MNTRTDDGLAKGAGNVIKLMQLHQVTTPSGIIWVQFDPADIGHTTRHHNSNNHHNTYKVFNQHGHVSNLLLLSLLLLEIELFK